MGKSSTSFKPGKSGNPGGRRKGVRALTKLIDSIGDEACSEGDEDFRTITIRRLWEAAATGRLNLGSSSEQLNAEQWIGLVQWLIKRTDDAAVEHWKQTKAESEAAQKQEIAAKPDGATTWKMMVEEILRGEE